MKLRILRAKNPSSPRTPRHVGASSAIAGTEKQSGSFHDPAQLVGRVKSRVARPRVLMAKSPTDPLTRDISQFTDNPNPKYDPSRKPGAVKTSTSVRRPRVNSGGHQKTIKQNRFSLFGGKTLKRKQF